MLMCKIKFDFITAVNKRRWYLYLFDFLHFSNVEMDKEIQYFHNDIITVSHRHVVQKVKETTNDSERLIMQQAWRDAVKSRK